MAKNIIVPVDFSECSENAIKYAAALAKKINGKLVLLHVYHPELVPSEVPFDMAYYDTGKQARTHQALGELAGDVENMFGIKCDYLTRSGSLHEGIEEAVKIRHSNLVVMGTEGATGWYEFFIGSETARVIEKVKHPVIAVPRYAAFNKGINRICFATDYHDNDIETLKQIEKFARALGAHIEVLHIAEGNVVSADEDTAMERFMEKAEKEAPYLNMTYRLLNGENVEKELEKYLVDHKVGLMAVSTRHRNWFQKIFDRSISKKLVMHTRTPVMVFHYKKILSYLSESK